MKNSSPKLSIIVSLCKKGIDLKRCIDSLIYQSYDNIEIIIVNDALKIEYDEVIFSFKNNTRIKYIEHDSRKGTLQTKISGYNNSTGKYIAFIEADNYVSVDFYRPLVKELDEKNFDMAIGNIVLFNDDGKKEVYNLFDSAIPNVMEGKMCIKNFLSQSGLCYAWHVNFNKVYSRKIWQEAVSYYREISDNVKENDDIVVSTILFYLSKNIIKLDNDAVFYNEHNDRYLVYSIKNIEESFKYIYKFLSNKNILNDYKANIINWEKLEYIKWYKSVKKLNLSDQEVDYIENILKSANLNENFEIKDCNYFYNVKTKWNDDLEWIKSKIISNEIEYISFDIFDTLVTRPFIEPLDLFKLLDNYFRQVTGVKIGIEFSKIRVLSEKKAREIRWKENKEKPEITLDEIYKVIRDMYGIDGIALQKLKEKEIEYEIRFCNRRKTIFKLYELALFKNKKVIFTSDMYLSSDVIKAILNKNGYTNFYKLYLSSDVKFTKSSGGLYKYVLEDLGTSSGNIIHIGDNFSSDVEKAKENGILGIYFPKCIDIYWRYDTSNNLSKIFYKSMSIFQDNVNAINFIGIRCMIALMVNKYFDNPFRYFNENSDFNADPLLIGYHVLGMHLFAVVDWLMKDVIEKGYEKVVFMARDGYHPLKAYEALKKIYKDAPEVEYLPVSRRSLFQISLLTKMDFYKLSEVINVKTHTPRNVLMYINDIIDVEKIDKVFKRNLMDIDKVFNDVSEFDDFITIVIEELYNKEKHNKKLKILKEYFSKIYSGKACTFDVGYSARPELYISNLCDKSIDTYFENIATDIAYQHASIGKFKLNTFYEYKPAVSGTIREIIISEVGPSCIGYDCRFGKVEPIYEEYSISYQSEFILTTLQRYALEFVEDMVNIFQDELKLLFYQKLYAVLPLEVYVNSSREIDMSILECILLEDAVKDGKEIRLMDIWKKERRIHNQLQLDKLFDIDGYEEKDIKNIQNISKDQSKKSTLLKKIKDLFFKKN